MSLVENYGQPNLETAVWPNTHDPHRCGTAPFVPNVNGPIQNSCGSYGYYFNKNGCNRYMPNYPDDLYIAQHGCNCLADCKNGVPPTGDIGREGTRFVQPGYCPELVPGNWPAEGYVPESNVGPGTACALEEGFHGGRLYRRRAKIINMLFWLIVLVVVVMVLRR